MLYYLALRYFVIYFQIAEELINHFKGELILYDFESNRPPVFVMTAFWTTFNINY